MTWFRKIVILSHRYLGIALSLLFVVWFASGITMMWAGGMPRLTPDERLERLPAARPACRAADAGRAPRRRKSAAAATTLLTVMGRPAYRIGGPTLSRCSPITATCSRRSTRRKRRAIASRFMTVPDDAGRISSTITEPDQWTLGQSRQMPLHKFSVDDPAAAPRCTSRRDLAEVTMMTTRRSRTLAWLGTIPHWFYFAALRDNQPLWYQIVVWTSGLGCRAGASRADPRRHAVPMVAAAAVDRHPLFRLDALALHHRRDLRRVHADVGVQRHAVDGAVRLGDAAGPADPARRVHRRRRRARAFPGDGSGEVGPGDGRPRRHQGSGVRPNPRRAVLRRSHRPRADGAVAASSGCISRTTCPGACRATACSSQPTRWRSGDEPFSADVARRAPEAGGAGRADRRSAAAAGIRLLLLLARPADSAADPARQVRRSRPDVGVRRSRNEPGASRASTSWIASSAGSTTACTASTFRSGTTAARCGTSACSR